MKWYVAKVLLKCIVGKDQDGPLTVDLQVRVLRAPDPEAAYEKAVSLGKREETEYKNSENETVRWVFLGLSDLEELLEEAIEDKTEITSELYASSNPSRFVTPKEELAVFWGEQNKKKTARELLQDQYQRRRWIPK